MRASVDQLTAALTQFQTVAHASTVSTVSAESKLTEEKTTSPHAHGREGTATPARPPSVLTFDSPERRTDTAPMSSSPGSHTAAAQIEALSTSIVTQLNHLAAQLERAQRRAITAPTAPISKSRKALTVRGTTTDSSDDDLTSPSDLHLHFACSRSSLVLLTTMIAATVYTLLFL